MNSILTDAHIAIRRVTKAPVRAIAIAITIGLGVGTNVAIDSVLHHIVAAPLPVANPETLVRLVAAQPMGDLLDSYSFDLYEKLRAASEPLDDISAFARGQVAIAIDGRRLLETADLVTPNYFDALGIKPHLGSFFETVDGVNFSGSPRPSVILGYDFWKTHFGGDPLAVGSDLRLGSGLFTIIGVAPRGFWGLIKDSQPGVWLPVQWAETAIPGFSAWQDPEYLWLQIFGRTGDARKRQQVLSSMQIPFKTYLTERGATPQEIASSTLQFDSLARGRSYVYETYGRLAWLISCASLLLLLVACVNASNLLSASFAHNRRDAGLQLALGATRFRIIRQVILEICLILGAGGLIGIVAAYATIAWSSTVLGLDPNIPVQPLVLTYGLYFIAGSVGLASVLPVYMMGHLPIFTSLISSGIAVESRGAEGLFGLFVAIQATLCTPILIVASLLFQEYYRQETTPTGVSVDRIAQAKFDAVAFGYDDLATARTSIDRFVAVLSSHPDVEAVALGTATAYSARTLGREILIGATERSALREANYAVTGPEYFSLLDIPLLAGRPFGPSDTEETAPVALINRKFADKLFGGTDAVGQTFYSEDGKRETRIVGIVQNHIHKSREDIESPFFYIPIAQRPLIRGDIYVKSRLSADNAVDVLNKAIQAYRGNLLVYDIHSMRQSEVASLATGKALAHVVGGAAVCAVLVAALGLSGILMSLAVRRLPEFGLRKALGATPRRIVVAFMTKALIWVGFGGIFGCMITALIERYLREVVVELEVPSGLTYVLVFCFLLGVAAASACGPGIRASKADPMTMLRAE